MILEGVDWELDEPLPDGFEAVVRFQHGVVTGGSGCNSFRGTYTLKADTIDVPDRLAVTRRSCPDTVLAVERSFLVRLVRVRRWSVDDEGLVLAGARDEPLQFRRR